MCEKAFEIILKLQYEKKLKEASNALVFLMMLKPFISGCWITLGDLWTEMNQYDDALYAYLVAINCAPFTLEPYQYAIRFCLAHERKQEALRILDYGIDLTTTNELRNEEENKHYLISSDP